MPNLSRPLPVVTWSWVSASTSGLTRKRHAGPLAEPGADAVQEIQLRRGLDVEEQYALPEAGHELFLRLPHPGEDDLLGVEPGPHGPVEFTPGDDVRPCPERGEGPQHGEVAVGLDRKADEVVQPGERLVEFRVRPVKGVVAVDVGGRTRPRGYLGERHVLAAESAPLVVKVVQNVPPRVAGACYIFGSVDGAVGRIYSVPNPRATPQANKSTDTDSTPPLLLNPILAHQGAYPLLRLDERRRALEETGAELFDFGTGDPREPTDERIRQALIDGVPKSSRYPSTAGKRELREAFCGWMERRHGVTLDPESEVLPATGSKEAIFHAPLAFLHHSHGRRGVAYGTPGYPVYERGTLFAGGEALPVELKGENGFLLPPEAVDPE